MNKKYKWGIIGPGTIAHKFVQALSTLENGELYAVASRDLGRAQIFAKQYGFTKAFGSYQELAEDPDVEIVYIATPHPDHFASSIFCMKAGKHVLCEKPVAMNREQLRIMVETAREKNLFFMEALWTRFLPSYKKCKEWICDGTIGDVTMLRADLCYKAQYNEKGRLFAAELGGGSLLDVGIYPLFLALDLLGKPIDLNALAIIGETGVDNSCSIQLKHRNGALSILYSSLVINGPIEAVIHGQDGMIKMDFRWYMPSTVHLIKDGVEIDSFTSADSGNGYQYEASEVMHCIDKKMNESESFPWQKSIELMDALCEIRKSAGIKYSSD
jgi:predicted dehydrogenase